MKYLSRSYYSFRFLTKDLVIGTIVLNLILSGIAFGQAVDRPNAASGVFRDFSIAARRRSADPRAVSDTALERLAVERKQALKQLLAADPQGAAANIVDASVLDSAPAAVKQHLEKPVSFYGDLAVFVIDEKDRSRTERFVTVGGVQYPAVVYGRRLETTSKNNIPMNGAIIDGVMLLTDSPARKLSAGELNARGLAADSVAADVGGELKFFSDEADLARFESAQLEAESKPGPHNAGAAVSAWTTGPKSVLCIRVDFSDAPGDPIDMMGQPFTLSRAQAVFANEIAPFYANNSYGMTSLTATVTPTVRVPQTKAFYSQGSNYNTLLTDARAAARSSGFDTNNFDLDVVAFGYSQVIPWAGIAGVGFKGALVNGSFSLGTIAHELGHSYGLWHANAWRTNDGTIIGAGANVEYGDIFDTMGMGGAYGAVTHFNAHYKRRLDWLNDTNVRNVTTSGVYRIATHDSATPGGSRVLKIRKDDTRNYWVEYRDLILNNGVTVRWDYASRNFAETQLLDMTPQTPGNVGDASLLTGQTFNDTQSGVTITVLGANNTVPASIDIRVDLAGSNPAPTSRVFNDFDGDGKSDPAIYRPAAGEWWHLRSSDGTNRAARFGIATDTIVPGDFTGDGRSDIAIWRPSTGQWFINRSEDNTFYGFPFGGAGDIPVPADYDGDGKTDAAVFRPASSAWYIALSGGGTRIDSFGSVGDRPVPADYDGDGKADIAVFRPNGATGGEWWLKMSTAGVRAAAFGLAGDRAVPGDYTGDGKADIAVWRPSTGFWYILRSEDSSFYGFPFGALGDTPTPGDFDGDGKFDPSVVRPGITSVWYINGSASGQRALGFGTIGDIPVQSAGAP